MKRQQLKTSIRKNNRGSSFPLRNSLYPRFMAFVIAIVVGTIILLTIYTLRQFERLSIYQSEHEALVLSDALQAAITPALMGEPNIEELQAHIDRVVAKREKNDVEINIMLLRGYRSAIVASNIPDNIESTSIYEHRDLLASLKNGQPIMFIGRDVDSVSEPPAPPTHPDFYIAPGHRFISVTSPLVIEKRKMGSINVKLSLFSLDQKLRTARISILIAVVLELVILASGIGLYLNFKLFKPLWGIAKHMRQFGSGQLKSEIAAAARSDEIGTLAKEFNSMVTRINKSFERERRFSSDAAHELRTPVATLKSGIQAALLTPPDSKKDRRVLNELLQDVTRLEDLCDSLLLIAHSQVEAEPPEMGAEDWILVIEEVVEHLRPLAESQKSRIHLNKPEFISEYPVLRTNSAVTHRIASNLLENAICHGGPGTKIDVEILLTDSRALLAVQDNGPGVAAEDVAKLFDRFFRTDRARSRETGGAGLGLAICQSLAASVGGTIRYEPVSPHGSRFIWHVCYYNYKADAKDE